MTFAWSSAWRAAHIRTRHSLGYADGADASLDRPAHVRAGSGCVLLPGPLRRLAVVQDDAHFIAVVNLASLHVAAITLEAGPGGLRQFDPVRGNKPDKLDLEAIIVVRHHHHTRLWCIGSGSLARREHIVTLDMNSGNGALGTPQQVALPEFYSKLRAQVAAVGGVLNLEGACVVGDELWLWNRGNDALAPDQFPEGAPGGKEFGINVVMAVSLSSMFDHVEGRGPAPDPRLQHTVRLPSVAGVPLTITDAARIDGGCVLLAAAEASPNAIDDGEVVGAAIGWWSDEAMAAGAPPQLLPLLNEDGAPALSKVEGIAVDDDNRAWLVVDADDPTVPAELFHVQFA